MRFFLFCIFWLCILGQADELGSNQRLPTACSNWEQTGSRTRTEMQAYLRTELGAGLGPYLRTELGAGLGPYHMEYLQAELGAGLEPGNRLYRGAGLGAGLGPEWSVFTWEPGWEQGSDQIRWYLYLWGAWLGPDVLFMVSIARTRMYLWRKGV